MHQTAIRYLFYGLCFWVILSRVRACPKQNSCLQYNSHPQLAAAFNEVTMTNLFT